MDQHHLSSYAPRSPSPTSYAPQSPSLHQTTYPGHSHGPSSNYPTYSQPAPFGAGGNSNDYYAPTFDGSYQPNSAPFSSTTYHQQPFPASTPWSSSAAQSYPTPESTDNPRGRGRPPKRKAEDETWSEGAPPKLARQKSSGAVAPPSQPPYAGLMTIPPPHERLVAPGEKEGIVIKNKFPVARIKRLVQADEDIGKVAQVTPVVVGRALELFMTSLALKSADLARARNSKRITGQHLKAAIMAEKTFDFCMDIVEKIPDAPTAPQGRKKEDEPEGDEDEEHVGHNGRRKRAAAGRKGRVKRDDDDEE